MSRFVLTDKDLRRYLLDLLNESEESDVGAVLLEETSESVERIISLAEKQLISDYIQGRLSGEEQQRFRSNFLTTDFRRELFESLWLSEVRRAIAEEPPMVSGYDRVLHFISRFSEILTFPGLASAIGAMKPAIAIQAQIAEINSLGVGSVTISCGEDVYLAAGQVLDVFRPSPEAEAMQRFDGPPIGEVTIYAVRESYAIGRYRGEVAVKAGDYVKSRLPL